MGLLSWLSWLSWLKPKKNPFVIVPKPNFTPPQGRPSAPIRNVVSIAQSSFDINGTRNKVEIFDCDYFRELNNYIVDDEIRLKNTYEGAGITIYISGKRFEYISIITNNELTKKEGYVILMDTPLGIIERSVPLWAVKREIRLESDPEFYV